MRRNGSSTSAGRFFSISFPGGQATVRETTYESEYRITLPARVYTNEGPRGRYSVTVVNYKDTFKLHEERNKKCRAAGGDGDECQDDGPEDMRGALVFASWNFMKRDGVKLTHYAHFNSDRVEGHEIHLTNADGSRTSARCTCTKTASYSRSHGPPRRAGTGLFQISMRFLDSDLRPVRYEWSARCSIPTVIRHLRALAAAGGGVRVAGGPGPAGALAPDAPLLALRQWLPASAGRRAAKPPRVGVGSWAVCDERVDMSRNRRGSRGRGGGINAEIAEGRDRETSSPTRARSETEVVDGSACAQADVRGTNS